MGNEISYRGYSARVEYDPEDRIFFGRVAGIRGGVGFHSASVDGLLEAFQAAVEDYLETCARVGKPRQRPALLTAIMSCRAP